MWVDTFPTSKPKFISTAEKNTEKNTEKKNAPKIQTTLAWVPIHCKNKKTAERDPETKQLYYKHIYHKNRWTGKPEEEWLIKIALKPWKDGLIHAFLRPVKVEESRIPFKDDKYYYGKYTEIISSRNDIERDIRQALNKGLKNSEIGKIDDDYFLDTVQDVASKAVDALDRIVFDSK